MNGHKIWVKAALIIVGALLTGGVVMAMGSVTMPNTSFAQTMNDFWSLTGSAGTTAGVNFLGTTDNEPLELHVHGERALRLEPSTDPPSQEDTVNIIGGSKWNSVANHVAGATISGGGFAPDGPLKGSNEVRANFGTISGGRTILPPGPIPP